MEKVQSREHREGLQDCSVTLQQLCHFGLQVGKLLYCYDRGRTSCCFEEEKCGGNWAKINYKMTQEAVSFMKRPKAALDHFVNNLGYDSCHKTEDYDAEPCHQDCLVQEKSQFAKECRERGGLYKCCIRLVQGGAGLYKCLIRVVRVRMRTV